MTATVATFSPAAINALVQGRDRRGTVSVSVAARGFDIPGQRQIVTDGISTDGDEAFFVAAKTHRVEDADGNMLREYTGFQVYGVELVGRHAGSVEILMDEYRTQAEAEAIAARYARVA